MDLLLRLEKSGMKPNRVNFDFEEALYRNEPLYKSTKIVNKLEYIYFFFNESTPLYSEQNYSKSTFKYYKDLIKRDVEVTCDSPYYSWWGDIEDFEESKRINSKVEQTKYLSKMSLIPDDILITKESEVIKLESSKDYYFRSEYGFSGLGNTIVKSKKTFTSPRIGVIGKYRDVILSFGVTFRGDDFFICMNKINKGKFVGGEIISLSELSVMSSYLNQDRLHQEIVSIVQSIKNFTKKDWGQFDSFFYKEECEIKWYKVVEINQRKTMSLMAKKCEEHFGQGSLSFSQNSARDIPLFSKDQSVLKLFYRLK